MKCLILDREVFHLKDGIFSYFFKIKNGDDKEYSVNLKYKDGNLIGYHCTCIFYSYYGWSKKNLKKNNPPVCRHIKMAIDEIKREIIKN